MLTSTVCAALSAAGLAIAFLAAYRRRFVAATRIAAIALLPVGLAMAGLVELGGEVTAAVGDWAAGLVLEPTVWGGFGVLATAVVLYVIAKFAEKRSGGRASRQERRTAARADGRESAVSAGESRQALGGSRQSSGGAAAPAEDFSDIEEILKKHGI